MADPPRILLASASPRRAALLEALRLPIEVRPTRVDETATGPPEAQVVELARRKAAAVLEPGPGWVLAADTLVDRDGVALGQPAGAEEARRMLASLAGRVHRVHTGVAVRRLPDGPIRSGIESASVAFRPRSADAVAAYVATGEPLGKAGAYALQGAAAAWVERLEGDPWTVIGLPARLTLRLLAEAGYPLPAHLAP
ncbi:MAG TPA: Maf family protein [Candidatus Thermoplasmatota archaeon]|nr:Maf family protein [Candidatus Thermoplasmatota archaeon]